MDRRLLSADQYSYSALPPSQTYIRFLRLLPHPNSSAPIQCYLFEYPLEQSGGSHLYEALSYVWGDPNQTLPILVGDAKLAVTVNLHAALIQLRDTLLGRVLWVDAISIDQANLEERASQVQLMAQIYACASRVVVWLGEESNGSTSALFAMQKILKNPMIHLEKAVFNQSFYFLTVHGLAVFGSFKKPPLLHASS